MFNSHITSLQIEEFKELLGGIEKDIAWIQSFSSSAFAFSNPSRGGSRKSPVQRSPSDNSKTMKQRSGIKTAKQVVKEAKSTEQESSVAVEKTMPQVKKKRTRKKKKKKKDGNVVSKVSSESDSTTEDEEITKPDKLVSKTTIC